MGALDAQSREARGLFLWPRGEEVHAAVSGRRLHKHLIDGLRQPNQLDAAAGSVREKVGRVGAIAGAGVCGGRGAWVGEHEGEGELEVSVNIYLTQAVRKGRARPRLRLVARVVLGCVLVAAYATRKPSNASTISREERPWVSSALAIVVLSASLVLQTWAKPYTFAFQNSLEVYLLLASILVIVLGLAYTFVAVQSPVVEVLMMAVLIGSLVLGGGYLIFKHVREHLRKRRRRPSQLRRRAGDLVGGEDL